MQGVRIWVERLEFKPLLTVVCLQKGIERNKSMKKITLIFMFLFVGKVFANCAIPGWPGCSDADFQNAMQLQRQQNMQEQQLRELQRANQLSQQLIEQQRKQFQQQQLNNMLWQEPMIVPQNYYDQQRQLKCLNMPLGTRGC
jgi:hypothetical protein